MLSWIWPDAVPLIALGLTKRLEDVEREQAELAKNIQQIRSAYWQFCAPDGASIDEMCRALELRRAADQRFAAVVAQLPERGEPA